MFILPKPKLLSGFSNILFTTALARKKINQAFIVTMKVMVDFKCFSGKCVKRLSVSNTLTDTLNYFLQQPLDPC